MNKRLLNSVVTVAAVLTMAGTGWGQSLAYSNAIVGLNPAGYWPLQETGMPAAATIETNYGTLGALGTAYYASTLSSQVALGAVGALTTSGDNDAAATFNATTSSFLFVPRVSPALTVQAPFTAECWINVPIQVSSNFFDILGEGGSGQNSPPNTGNAGGFRLTYGGNKPGGPDLQLYLFNGNGVSRPSLQAPANTLPVGMWHHCVATFDGITATLYVDGAQVDTGTFITNAPDRWSPLSMGGAFWRAYGPASRFHGMLDEVAIYTNVLTSIQVDDHWLAGTTPGSNYMQAVLSDQPLLYYRMDCPAYTNVAVASCPVAANYGSVPVNGAYLSGTRPGAVAGPLASGLSANVASPINGVTACIDAGFNAAFNPTGTQPFTALCWFKGNPGDGRPQTLMSQGTDWSLDLVGTNGTVALADGAGTVVSTNILNDGNWHFAAGVYDGTRNYLYVDGELNNSAAAAGSLAGDASHDLYLGGNAALTSVGANEQYLAGAISQAAFFTSALTAAQVRSLYDSAGVPPTIEQQPVSADVNQGGAFTNTVVVSGSAPFSYQWYKDDAPIAGQTNASLVYDPVLPAYASTNYYVIVTNNGGSVTSSVVSLTVFSAPSFLVQPAYTNLIIFVGGHVSVSVLAGGAEPLSYQWYTNGVPDASPQGASTSYSYPTVITGSSLYCVVSNNVGAATSSVVTLTVVADPAAPYPAKVLADNPYGFWRLNEADNGLDDGNAGVISHDYWGGNNGTYTNVNLGLPGYALVTEPTETSALFGQTAISFIDSYVGAIEGIDFSAPTNSNSDFSIEAWVKGGSQSSASSGIVTKGYGNGGEQFDLDCYNNHFRFFVRDASGGVHAYTSTISPDGQWHHLVGVCDESGGTVTLYIDGQAVGTAAITPGSGILASANVMTIGARRSGINTNNYDFQWYGNIDDVAVYDYALSAEQVRAHWSAPGVPPVLTELPPTAVTVYQGGTLTLPAAGIGTPPLTNTWFDTFYFTNVAQIVVTGTNRIDGTLVVSNVSADWDFDTLQLTLANAYGSVTTNVTLTVISGPPVVVQDLPLNVTLIAGDQYTYTIGVQGTEPFSYQWYSNNVAVPGATTASLTINSAPAGHSTYYVAITNIEGSAVSAVSRMMAVLLTNSYSGDILALDPAGYWPLQETAAPAAVTMETNYGTLGALGNAYYAATSASQVTLGAGGALTAAGDNDPATVFNGVNGPTYTGYLFVPRRSPALTLTAPFSLECWLNSTSLEFGDLIGQGGSGLNSPVNSGNAGGVRLSYGGNKPGGPDLQVYFYTGSGLTHPSLQLPANTLPAGVWHHCVLTYDGGTADLYIDGALAGSQGFTMAPDTWSPLTIGAGLWQGYYPIRGYQGIEDEVAVYTNVLTATQITNHWLAGTTAGSNYVQTVLNDQPLLYYRMDASAYTNVPAAFCPVATNYGTAPVYGAYLSGTPPGAVAGPPIVGPSGQVASPINGIISCIDAGYDAAFDPAGTQPFTALCWFKGYPGDGRMQTIMGQGTNWMLALLGTNGTVALVDGAGSVASTNVLNDGNWHFIAGVYDGVNNYLYVDGALNNSAAVSGTLGGDAVDNLYLGGNAAYTGVGTNQMYLAGAIAQAAFVTNALTAPIIQQIYQTAVTVTVNPNPTNLVFSVNGDQLTLSWPADHTGWTLQAQTNNPGIGLGTNWFDVSGSSATNEMVVPINPASGSVFYRLVYP